mgnify:CR=1 FL=1
MKKNLYVLLSIVGLIAYIFTVPYAIALGGKYGAFKTADYDGTEVVEIVPKGFPCKYGEGVAYIHTDISTKYYPLTIWCPSGYYFLNLVISPYSDSGVITGQIKDNTLNNVQRSNVLKIIIRDQHKELGGKAISSTWSDELGLFTFNATMVIPSESGFDYSNQAIQSGHLVIEIDGHSAFGCSTYTYNDQLVLEDFKWCLVENGNLNYHTFSWTD